MSPHKWPVPVHIRACVFDALKEAAKSRGEDVPLWAYDAVTQGINDAIRQHECERRNAA